MVIIASCILDIIVGWYLGQDLLLDVVALVMVEAMDEVEISMYMSLSMKALFWKRIGKSMLVSIKKRTIEINKLTQMRFT